MQQRELEKFKEKLLELRAELEGLDSAAQDSQGTVVLDQSSVGRLSRMDALQGQQMALDTQRRRNKQLAQIKAALVRIDQNDYGYCLDCGKEIAGGRLSVNPAATHCIGCADK